MSASLRPRTLGIGLAIFSMFFGAGNSIFPLYVGYFSQENWLTACMGLLLTSVVMPIFGIIAMLRSEGKPLQFFGRLGRIPGLVAALLVILLLGPFGSTPRCIALAYSTLVEGEGMSMILFSGMSCLLLFFCSLKKEYILPILGYVLTPVLLLSLAIIVTFGVIEGGSLQKNTFTLSEAVYFGLSEGYKTMDLLAAFFFSSTILHLLGREKGEKKTLSLLLKGGMIGGGLLALIYIGFAYIAALHSEALVDVPQEQLLRVISEAMLGSRAAILVKIAIAVACLTTAIALITSFVDFIQVDILRERFSYHWVLGVSLLTTFAIAIFEFTAISSILAPILTLLYPGLILLTFVTCLLPVKKEKLLL